MKVRVGKIPGHVSEYELPDGATVADALKKADLDPTGYEIRLNTEQQSDTTATMSDGDILLIAKRIKGA